MFSFYLASLSSGLSASLLNLHCSFLVLILSCRSDSVCRDLKAALLFLYIILSAPSQSKQIVSTNSVLVCVYDTSHLFLPAFLIACEFDLALFSFLTSLVELVRSLHYSPCYCTCNSELNSTCNWTTERHV